MIRASGWGPRRIFAAGVLAGVLAVFGLRWAIIESRVPDWLVAPLLLSDTQGTADAIVVLGAGIVGDCVPNLNGVRRALLGVRLWRAGRAPLVVFTGGQSDAPCAIAESMVRFSRELGLPDDATRVDLTAKSTRENATSTLPLLQQSHATRVLLVTDRLHMRRAAGAFARLGLQVERASVPVYEGHINNVDMLAAGAREMVALGYYRARGWLGDVNDLQGSPRTTSPSTLTGRAAALAFPVGPVIVLGASYAMGWPLSTVGGVPVVNRGGGGQVSAQMLERFDQDVLAARPRAVILWGFINDVFRATPEQIESTLALVRQNFTAMIERAEREGIEPVLATEVTVRADDSWSEAATRWVGRLLGRESYQERINRHVMSVNAWIVDVARQRGLLLLDFERVLGEDGGMRRREFTQEDGSHITPGGYEALSAYAVPVLEAHLGGR